MAERAQRQVHWDGYDAAHGFVRDSLASLRNLETLLKSPRIGPRALAKVVDELQPGMRPLGDALSWLIDLITNRKPEIDAASLKDCTLECVSQLDQAIERAAKSDMGAKSRLQLEAKVVQLGAELDALRDLVDLLDAATMFVPSELDLNALSSEALAKLTPPSIKHPRVVHVELAPGPISSVITDQRVIMPLLAIALGLVGMTKAKSIRVTATIDDNDYAQLACSALSNGQSAGTPCIVPRIVAPTLYIASTAATLAGASFEFDESGRTVRLAISPGNISQIVVKSDARMQH